MRPAAQPTHEFRKTNVCPVLVNRDYRRGATMSDMDRIFAGSIPAIYDSY